MRKQILVVALTLITALSFGQKKELKKAQKAIKANDYTEAMAQLSLVESMLGSADADLKAEFYAAKGEALLGSAGTSNFDKLKMAAEAFNQAMELDSDMASAQAQNIQNLKAAFVNGAVADQEAKRYVMAADKLYEGYKVSKVDTSYLFFAAANSVNAEDFDKALGYYEELYDLGYTGATMQYTGVDKETGEVMYYDNKVNRDLLVQAGELIKPEDNMADSKRGEILRNMTLIYIQNGEDDKAKSLMVTARAENPDDVSLMRADAEMARKLGDMKRYDEIMNEIIAADPDNPQVYFSLGEAASEAKDYPKAIEFYEKALEINPDFSGALINIGVLKLKREGEIVEMMNNLGTSRADNAKYDELKIERDKIYRDVLIYFEQAEKIEPENVGLVKALMNIYSQLGEDAKFKMKKERLEQLEN